MPLSTQNFKKVVDNLQGTFGTKNVSVDGTEIRVTVDKDDRSYRKKLLSEIAVMFKDMGAKYTPSGTKTGAVKISGVSIEVKGKTTKETGEAKFKPSDIEPSIVDRWLTPDQLVKNTITHIKNQNIPDNIKEQLLNVLKETAKDTKRSIPFESDKKLIPSEFFEVLTSIKLAVLMKSNDPETRKILGIPKKMDLSRSKIMIMIPAKANMPLLDYYISISASGASEENSLKISVKSKVSSPKSNTVKFTDAFKDNEEVMKWYNSLTDKKNQIGQKIIAQDSINAPSGKGLLYPITAVSDLIDNDKRRISVTIKEFLSNSIKLEDFASAVSTISSKITSFNKKTQISEIDALSYIEKSTISSIMQKNIKGLSAKDITVGNLTYLCEKILQKASPSSASPENIATKYNFYQMFFDRVLKDREIAYAVSSLSGKTLNYNFYSLVNFAKEYKDWIGLRSKNGINNLNDKLGMDV